MQLVAPLAAYTVTSMFGSRTHPVTGQQDSFHSGVDLDANTGDAVFAVLPGTVRIATLDARGINGNWIQIDHGSGWATAYLHLSRMDVAPGTQVRAGQRIGAVGSTGRSTGSHLHFMLYKDGKPIDPLPYLLGKASAAATSAASTALSVTSSAMTAGASRGQQVLTRLRAWVPTNRWVWGGILALGAVVLVYVLVRRRRRARSRSEGSPRTGSSPSSIA